MYIFGLNWGYISRKKIHMYVYYIKFVDNVYVLVSIFNHDIFVSLVVIVQ